MKAIIACGIVAALIAALTGNAVSIGGIWVLIIIASLIVRALQGLSIPDLADEHRRRSS